MEKTRRWPRRKEVWVSVVAVLLTIALGVAAIYYKDTLMSVAYIARYSLLGVFVIAFLAGSVLSVTAVPVPYIIVVFALPSVLASQWGLLAPVWVGAGSALGASLGQFLTFIIAHGGSHLSQRLSSFLSTKPNSVRWSSSSPDEPPGAAKLVRHIIDENGQ